MTEFYTLVTGGTGKLGSVIATGLAKEGKAIILTSRNVERAESFADALCSNGGKVVGMALDLSDPNASEALVDAAERRGFHIDALVNNARSLDALSLNEDGTASVDAFASELSIDVIQPYRLTMRLCEQAGGPPRTVVNIGSMYGEIAPTPALYGGSLMTSPIQYGVAKSALHHLTRELAVRLAPHTRVNCVAFGGFEGRAPDSFKERYASLTPSGRMLQESEAFGPVAFLLSEKSASINGHVLVADGGWSIW